MVTVDSQKMGKSLNNFINLKQAFSGAHERLTRGYDPLAVRQLILNSHYRSPLDFSDAALFAAQSGYEKISQSVQAVRKRIEDAPEGEIDNEIAQELEGLKTKFEEAMNDDLNTSVALSVIFELVRLSNKLLENKSTTKESLSAVDDLFGKLGGDVLGIVKDEYEAVTGNEYLLDELVAMLIEQRASARNAKNFAAADAIRDRLDKLGVVLEDKPDETIWRRK
jgi:cysteinyl-tRNA synthetase